MSVLPPLNHRLRALAWVHILLHGIFLVFGTALCVSLVSVPETPVLPRN